ncbi:MAG: GNAT family N-acetyltransferase [Chloroflexi bacterium]|nr:GNAT family N-acetyltransferase [Chloroflexota bacterium]
MEIRLATLADLNACLLLDDSFETDYVWQVDERRDAHSISSVFRLTRLPRTMKVTGVISRDGVSEKYRKGSNLWVYDNGGVCGFIAASVEEWNQSANISHVAVARVQRRKKIGTQLMQTVLEWARLKKLSIVLADAPTKAYPAIAFYQKHGFSFCGFSDRLYPNRDIAMLFALKLR